MNNQNLYNNNPYRNPTYKESPWQGVLSSLGFRTQSDAWSENMAIQAKEYDAAIAQKLRDEEYNDPMNQVSRLRAAGINPDLEGGADVDSGSAAPMPEDPSTPMQATGDEPKLIEFGNLVLSSLSSALGLVNGVQGIFRNRAENMLSESRVEEAVRSLSKGIFLDSLPNQPYTELDNEGIELAQVQGLQMAESIIGKMPKNIRKRAMKYVNGYWNSAPANAEAFKTWLQGAQSEKGYFKETSEFYSFYPNLMRKIYRPLGQAAEDIYKLQQDAAKTGAENDVKEEQNRGVYLDSIDPKSAAAAENATNNSVATQKSIDSVINGAMKEITDSLNAASKKGGIEGMFASSLLVVMAMNRMQMLPSLPSFLK